MGSFWPFSKVVFYYSRVFLSFYAHTVKTPIKRPSYFQFLDEVSLNYKNSNCNFFVAFCADLAYFDHISGYLRLLDTRKL